MLVYNWLGIQGCAESREGGCCFSGCRTVWAATQKAVGNLLTRRGKDLHLEAHRNEVLAELEEGGRPGRLATARQPAGESAFFFPRDGLKMNSERRKLRKIFVGRRCMVFSMCSLFGGRHVWIFICNLDNQTKRGKDS